jgi:hypothetical protein
MADELLLGDAQRSAVERVPQPYQQLVDDDDLDARADRGVGQRSWQRPVVSAHDVDPRDGETPRVAPTNQDGTEHAFAAR